MLDLSNMPAEVRCDAAAVIREVLQQFPKALPELITEDEETPDEH